MAKEQSKNLELTPARIGVGRAGTRPTTSAWLAFRADHARARDAVSSELSLEFLQKMQSEFDCFLVESACCNRDDFIRFPPKGKKTKPEALELLRANCPAGCDVQILVSDGLSAKAVEANLPDLLPILLDGLKLEGISYGRHIIARLARVAIGDEIAHELKSRIVINLIGERPGLSTDESLSAYITLNPGPKTISSDRTVVSNIHKQGTPALEAGAYIVQLVKKIFKFNLSGVKLQQVDH